MKTLPLEQHWLNAWHKLEATPPSGAYANLLSRYSEAHRVYHTLQHLSECFARFEQMYPWIETHCQYPAEILMALWFHDAVYDVQRKDNEQLSAQLAAKILSDAGIQAHCVERVSKLILATCHHGKPISTGKEILMDIDLAIFATEPEQF